MVVLKQSNKRTERILDDERPTQCASMCVKLAANDISSKFARAPVRELKKQQRQKELHRAR